MLLSPAHSFLSCPCPTEAPPCGLDFVARPASSTLLCVLLRRCAYLVFVCVCVRVSVALPPSRASDKRGLCRAFLSGPEESGRARPTTSDAEPYPARVAQSGSGRRSVRAGLALFWEAGDLQLDAFLDRTSMAILDLLIDSLFGLKLYHHRQDI